ncbi:hypothetical protein SAMN06264365_101456 [Actinoplanes regularis]|uniref:Uncharacterized protein n=1 Tax=Actinoplanes regularis TaxID=52697 RepID=A0A238V131_9ACTN|nr:hypothetical protein SAMN06264365_101456 [Actinoplanes regularis]
MLRHVVPTDLYNYDENAAPEGLGRTGRRSGRRFCQAGREAAGRDRRPFATSDDLPSPGGMTWHRSTARVSRLPRSASSPGCGVSVPITVCCRFASGCSVSVSLTAALRPRPAGAVSVPIAVWCRFASGCSVNVSLTAHRAVRPRPAVASASRLPCGAASPSGCSVNVPLAARCNLQAVYGRPGLATASQQGLATVWAKTWSLRRHLAAVRPLWNVAGAGRRVVMRRAACAKPRRGTVRGGSAVSRRR